MEWHWPSCATLDTCHGAVWLALLCTECFPGHGGGNCTICSKGSFSPGGPAASTLCSPCDPGFTTPSSGATACTRERRDTAYSSTDSEIELCSLGSGSCMLHAQFQVSSALHASWRSLSVCAMAVILGASQSVCQGTAGSCALFAQLARSPWVATWHPQHVSRAVQGSTPLPPAHALLLTAQVGQPPGQGLQLKQP